MANTILMTKDGATAEILNDSKQISLWEKNGWIIKSGQKANKASSPVESESSAKTKKVIKKKK